MSGSLELGRRIEALSPADRERFSRLFEVRAATGFLDIPSELEESIVAWYGGGVAAEEALQLARQQPLLKTFNRATFEGALFNPLRARRPIRRVEGPSIDEWVEAARDGCDFCAPATRTTADVWGRIEGECSVTAANVAKYDAHHGLVVFGDHHPLRFGRREVRDYFDVALRWLERTRASDDSLVHGTIVWNCLERSGASQRHGHLHMLATAGRPYGRQEWLSHVAAEHRRMHGTDYWDEWLDLHELVGLVIRRGAMALAASITPIKNAEVIVVGRAELDGAVADCVADVLRAYIERLDGLSFNVAVYLPKHPVEAGDRVIVRCVSRGDPRQRSSDMGAMELYGTPIIMADPHHVIAAIGDG